MRRDSSELSRWGTCDEMSETSTAVSETRFQKRKRSVRVWSRTRLRAIRMSQVEMEQSPRKVLRADQARTKVSWVRDWATSRSRIEMRWKRKILCSYVATIESMSSSAVAGACWVAE